MSAPRLDIIIEPSESGAVVYLPLAPRALGEPTNGQVSLAVNIRNNEMQEVRVNQLMASFPHPQITPAVMSLGLVIAPSELAGISFETSNNMIVPEPAPEEILISLSCVGFSEPATKRVPLRPYQSPVSGGSYSFPAKAGDLRNGEYWLGGSASHASGSGTQLFGYDLGVWAFDTALPVPGWSYLLPGTDGTRNEHFLTWGKPIYAMADGVVISFRNNIPNNPNPPHNRELEPGEVLEVLGSHFRIQHDSELVVYPHLDPDSMNRDLLQRNARVTRGQLLGRAGNSGNSTAPHFHLHAMKAIESLGQERLRPIPFRGISVVDRTLMEPPNRNAPWVRVVDRGLPNVASLIWPAVAEPTRASIDLREWFTRSELRTRVWTTLLVLALAFAFFLAWLFRS